MESDNIPSGDHYFSMMDFMKVKHPFIDEQVNTKTGAFLGFADCEHWYNDGELYDCSGLMSGATRLLISKMQDKGIEIQLSK